ncbi:MAG: hypothetical protein D6707_11035 [Bacteroidetes bacterium]|nr:MAG: hypothetical protein D6707_11035 [Bacteroidota bacterium]
MKWAKVTDIYIAAHFWKEGSPYLFTREDAKKPEFKIRVVGDISCDIDGPVASTIRPSTIEEPIYAYHPHTEEEVEHHVSDVITVMAVDNLPCELPKDASRDFGEELIKNVLPYLVGEDDGRIKNATIAENGKLTPRYAYLQNYVDGITEKK